MTSSEQLATVRDDYDDKAEAYTAFIGEAFAGQPLNHVMIKAFADLVRQFAGQADGGQPAGEQAAGGQSAGGQVADVGCGPGHVTGLLRERGVDAFGVDLSPRLVAAARAAHPGVRFDVGDMGDLGALGVATGGLAGVVANYSVIHTPPDALPATLAELTRVLAPGGYLLLAFQALDATDAAAEPFDHKVSPAWRYSPDHVVGLLGRNGVTEVARLVIAPGEDPARGFPQAHLLGRRTAD
ncbi:class I SAM-dependent methyltransferase [Promicromonospora sp. NPDC059942]|uniref:class I SAM-dependent methyltransferase n=1 Tax=Promicromonospora sp. NPDC059942 TaxID=3347009 RepID=UPI0036667CDD